MRSGGDPAIPARIDRPRAVRTYRANNKNCAKPPTATFRTALPAGETIPPCFSAIAHERIGG